MLPIAIGPLSERLQGFDLAVVIGGPVFRSARSEALASYFAPQYFPSRAPLVPYSGAHNPHRDGEAERLSSCEVAGVEDG
jgi:hypothetical protein